LLGTPILRNKKPDLAPYRDYYRVTFIRNPFDRMVSAYYYNLQVGIKHDSFSHYLKTRDKWLTPFNKHMPYNFVGRFESLYEDYNRLLGIWDIPVPDPHPLDIGRQNKSKLRPKKHYREYYTDELRELVARQYAQDLKIFNYDF